MVRQLVVVDAGFEPSQSDCRPFHTVQESGEHLCFYGSCLHVSPVNQPSLSPMLDTAGIQGDRGSIPLLQNISIYLARKGIKSDHGYSYVEKCLKEHEGASGSL